MATGRVPTTANSPLTAKGDLFGYSTTQARVAVGNNGETLVADSSTATGLKWAAPASGGMTLISTTTLSGATVTLSSIPQTYVDLYLVIEQAQNATADGTFSINVNNTGGDIYGSGLSGTTAYSLSNSSIKANQTTLRTGSNYAMAVTFNKYTRTDGLCAFSAYGWDDNASSAKPFSLFGVFGQPNAITSLVLSNSGGSLTAGTAYLYGVK
jgi:hypothetical protein